MSGLCANGCVAQNRALIVKGLMKNLKSIHNAELRTAGHRWVFEIDQEPTGRIPVISITQKDPSGNRQKLIIYWRQLPAFISHLRRGLQEIGELGKK